MTAPSWDPQHYLAYADERGRPFVELVARIGAAAPGTVVDLGCGPGNLTALLPVRWPDAQVVGVDSSAAMVARALADPAARSVRFEEGDLTEWAAGADQVDVVVSNAALQWVPGHLDLLAALVGRLRPGGWLAFQVPGNFTEPSHELRRELAEQAPYAGRTAGVAHPASHDPVVYLDALARLGCTVDAWETTYLHVLTGPDPVFTWVSGTGARPTLQALGEPGEPLREQFETELKARLRAAYPERESAAGGGVVLPFRRIFVVAQKRTQEQGEGDS